MKKKELERRCERLEDMNTILRLALIEIGAAIDNPVPGVDPWLWYAVQVGRARGIVARTLEKVQEGRP